MFSMKMNCEGVHTLFTLIISFQKIPFFRNCILDFPSIKCTKKSYMTFYTFVDGYIKHTR